MEIKDEDLVKLIEDNKLMIKQIEELELQNKELTKQLQLCKETKIVAHLHETHKRT